MLDTFSFGFSLNLSQQKNPTADIIGIYFLGTIVPRKYMPIISAVGLFCYDKFEEPPNEKVVNMSKLIKPYFKEKWTLDTFVNYCIKCMLRFYLIIKIKVKTEF